MTVVIGVDPHKASVSIEARDSTSERLVATGRFGTDTQGYRQARAHRDLTPSSQEGSHVGAVL
jgi:hypothetical protein